MKRVEISRFARNRQALARTNEPGSAMHSMRLSRPASRSAVLVVQRTHLVMVLQHALVLPLDDAAHLNR